MPCLRRSTYGRPYGPQRWPMAARAYAASLPRKHGVSPDYSARDAILGGEQACILASTSSTACAVAVERETERRAEVPPATRAGTSLDKAAELEEWRGLSASVGQASGEPNVQSEWSRPSMQCRPGRHLAPRTCPVASRAPAASPPGGTSDFYSATRPDGRGDRLAASKHRRVRDAIESRGQCGSGEQFASRGLSRLVHSEIKRDRIVACSVRRRMLAIHGNCRSIELVSFWTVAVMEDEITRTGHT